MSKHARPGSRTWRRAAGAAACALVLASGVLALGGSAAEGAPVCPCSLLGGIGAPEVTGVSTSDFRSDPPPHSFELGLAFTVDEPVQLTAIRFYKDSAESGSHVVRLWNHGTQAELMQVAVAGESPSGWQEQALGGVVVLEPGITYAVSVNVNTHYAFSRSDIPQQLSSGPLSSVGDTKYGVYAMSAGAFPGLSADALYHVDVVVDELAPLAVDSVTPADGATAVPLAAAASGTFSRGVDASTLDEASFTLDGPGGAVSGTVAYDAPSRTATFTPSSPLAAGATYTATLESTIAADDGVTLGTDVSWVFTTASAPPPPPPPAPDPQQRPAPQADLSLELESPAETIVGDGVVLILKVVNRGFATATGVQVQATLPGGLSLQAARGTTEACTGVAVVRCSIGDLGVGETALVALTVTPTASGAATVVADVRAAEPDPNYGDNRARASLTVAPRILAVADVGITLRLVKTLLGPRTPSSSLRTWVTLDDAAQSFRPTKLQLAVDPARPWAWRSYLPAFSFRSRQSELWIRFADADSTITEWQKFRIVSPSARR